MSFLGIDLGTSGLRALLISAQGTPIGSSESHYNVSQPNSGWSEQDPADWIAALESVISELKNTYSEFNNLIGIGVAGHMHGATLLDSSGSVLRPCILWNDIRAKSQAKHLDETERVRSLSGNIVFPGFTAPKLEWVRQNEPDIFNKISKVLLPASYLNFYLTGDYVADMSDSAGTSWLDVGKRNWSDYLLDVSNMRCDQMPRLVEGSEAAGELRLEIKSKWGLSGKIIVAGGAGDNAAAACGIGALREGQGFVSIGTSGVILSSRDGYKPAPETAVHTFCHAVPGRWYQMGVMLSATDSLNWLAGITSKSPSELTSSIGDKLLKPGNVRFLPYLSGERTPHNDADIQGSITGIFANTSVDDLTRGVLEGVAFGLKDCFDALSATNTKMDQLTAIGGGTASRYWMRLLATILGTPLNLPEGGEFGAALGAARLGMAASIDEPLEKIIIPPIIRETIDPDTSMQSVFYEAHMKYKAAYPAIKSIQ
ncbi:MAG: xylulokinase [Amylibacter sp.]|nr:xylulokinase [Amylibacter sp.]